MGRRGPGSGENPAAGGSRSHRARGRRIPANPGLDPSAPPRPRGGQHDYYAQYPQCEDGGYLAELVDTCRIALAQLPSYPAVAAAARRAAARIVEFQSLNLSESQGDHDALARWGRAEAPAETGLRWWEAAAAGGSPLCLYALLAAAADPAFEPGDAEAIEHAYFPWIGALHSLLDHLSTDRRMPPPRSATCSTTTPRLGKRSVACRRSPCARCSAARSLPRGNRHAIVLVGMAGHYLSSPGATAPAALPIIDDLKATLGALVTPTLLVFRARRSAGTVASSWMAHPRLSPRRREPPRATARGSELRTPEQTALRPSP